MSVKSAVERQFGQEISIGGVSGGGSGQNRLASKLVQTSFSIYTEFCCLLQHRREPFELRFNITCPDLQMRLVN